MTETAVAIQRRWIALALLCVAQFVVVLDASIVNVALPTVGRALHFSESSLPWVVNAYVLTFGGFLLLGGRVADLIGRRRVFMAGLVLFAFASLFGGLATTAGQLIAARAVQGVGAAMLAPATLALLSTTFREGPQRTRAMAAYGVLAGIGTAFGLPVQAVSAPVKTSDAIFVLRVDKKVQAAAGAGLLAPRRFTAAACDRVHVDENRGAEPAALAGVPCGVEAGGGRAADGVVVEGV